MDCRKALALALGLAVGGSGCVTTKTTGGSGSSPADPVPYQAKKPLPPRIPKASTCAAFGDFRAKQAATEPNVPDTERERYRDQARRAYQQALQIDPSYLPAYTGLARLYTELRDYDRAVATFQKALKAHPKEASLWFDLGMVYSRQKKWDPALENLQAALKLDPENRQYVTTFGYCLARAGRFEESVTVLAGVVGRGEAHYRVARMAHHMNQDDLCKQHLQLALNEKPDLADARRMLAQLEGRAQPVAPAGFDKPGK